MSEKADYRHIDKKMAREADFPAQMESEYRVYFTEDAYARMRKHVETTNEVELLGVLIGDIYRDSQGCFLKITAIIEGKDTNNQGAQVTLTHQAWDHINAVKDKEHPKERIVGWYHTHPGFGIFLSGMDLFIQNSYFNHPFQIAIVVETKKNQEGCFAWVDGKSAPLRRYWVGRREVELVTGGDAEVNLNPVAEKHADAPPEQPRRYEEEPAGRLGSSIFSFLIAIMMLFCGYMLGKMSSIQELRESAMVGVESELYSILEYAAVNTAAAKDLEGASEKLKAINEKIQKGDSAAAGKAIAELGEQLGITAKTFEKQRSTFRKDLDTLAMRKQSLADRVETGLRHQDAVDRLVAQLYVLRIGDMLRRETMDDPTKLSEHDRLTVRMLMDEALKLAPDLKAGIDQMFPKLIPALYPENNPVPPQGAQEKNPSAPANGK